MISGLPMYLNIVFVLATLLAVFLFYKASNRSKTTLFVLLTWLLIQAIVSLTGFYTITDTTPPRFPLLVLPPVLLIIGLFASRNGRVFIDSLNAKTLTILHIVRIPVELTLYWLFVNKAIPELMTFEGRNFDILSGITGPVVYYFGYIKKKLSNAVLLIWNLLCLGLLFNIVINAVLSLPSSFQKFAFDQPNIGVLYFPFVWLPCCVVPLVLMAHLACIRKILVKK